MPNVHSDFLTQLRGRLSARWRIFEAETHVNEVMDYIKQYLESYGPSRVFVEDGNAYHDLNTTPPVTFPDRDNNGAEFSHTETLLIRLRNPEVFQDALIPAQYVEKGGTGRLPGQRPYVWRTLPTINQKALYLDLSEVIGWRPLPVTLMLATETVFSSVWRNDRGPIQEQVAIRPGPVDDVLISETSSL